MKRGSESDRILRGLWRRALACLIAAQCLAFWACDGAGAAKIGEVTLAQLTMGSAPVPESAADAPLVEVRVDETPTIPPAPVVQLAIDNRVPWGMVRAILRQMESQGQTPILLVADPHKVRTFHVNDELEGPVITVLTYTDGQICVQHPSLTQAKCTRPRFGKKIDAAYTRELAREALEGYKRRDFVVDMALSLTWGDVVSAVGGTRSCCDDEMVRVRIRD